uniref:Uncharacterized protein n=1 Tax=Salix viminalis TaxID=40686 RepID=A0A6N2LQR9_SALVM
MRYAFSEALGSLLALGMNPEAQVFIKHVILVMAFFFGPHFPSLFFPCDLIGCCLLLEAFGFALHKSEWNSIEGCENWHNLIMGLLFIGNSSKVSASR